LGFSVYTPAPALGFCDARTTGLSFRARGQSTVEPAARFPNSTLTKQVPPARVFAPHKGRLCACDAKRIGLFCECWDAINSVLDRLHAMAIAFADFAGYFIRQYVR
jgi:hypothetical protein